MNDYLELEKRKVRHEFLYLRNGLEPFALTQHSINIFNKIKELSIYSNAKTVMFYLSYGSEVITDFMINSAIKDNKNVAVPSIDIAEECEMKAVSIMDIKDANEKMYGIRQPAIDENYVLNKNEIDLMFVPAVAFDLHGYRMGYGKGYYDRWLGNVDIDRTVGLAFDCQIAEKLPIGKYDIPVGMIITERRIAETKKLIEQRGGNG